MTYRQLIRYFGSGTSAAKALKISSSSIYQWGNNGFVPFDTQYRIEVLTGGVLKADRINKNPRKKNIHPGTRKPHFN